MGNMAKQGQIELSSSQQDQQSWFCQSLWLSRAATVNADTLKTATTIAIVLAGEGDLVPPAGWMMDLFSYLTDSPSFAARSAAFLPGVDPALLRRYEDHVVGRLALNVEIDRARDALVRYRMDDRPRGVAFVIRAMMARWKLPGVLIDAAILRGIIGEGPARMLAAGYESAAAAGPHALIPPHLEAMIAAFRSAGELLEADDIAALEQKTPLDGMAKTVAHRQVLRLANQWRTQLPDQPLAPRPGRREVRSHLRADDHYPVGGYSSIGPRGSLESLLQSQLAYMDSADDPDFFAIKYLRDELLYYSRDENQFLRRRRSYVVTVAAELKAARIKDANSPAQRIVMLLGWLAALIATLDDWLSVEALDVRILLESGLDDEAAILLRVLATAIERGSVAVVQNVDSDARASMLAEIVATTGVHLLNVAMPPSRTAGDGVIEWTLDVSHSIPVLCSDTGESILASSFAEPAAVWSALLTELLPRWI
jgi:hypothetical protein